MSHPTLPTLNMPLFVNPADVIQRMQLSVELDGLQEIVESGIRGAQIHVERIIGGKLRRTSQECNFYVDADAFSGIAPGGVYRLEMPSGFIRADTPLLVEMTEPRAQAWLDTPFGVFNDVDPTLMKVDYRRGYVMVDAGRYGNSYVHVVCDTGFNDGTRPIAATDEEQWLVGTTYTVGNIVQHLDVVYKCTSASLGTEPPDTSRWAVVMEPVEEIPDELKEAIISLVPMVFNSQQATNRSANAKDQYRTMTDHAELILQEYVRTKGFSFRPV